MDLLQSASKLLQLYVDPLDIRKTDKSFVWQDSRFDIVVDWSMLLWELTTANVMGPVHIGLYVRYGR